MMELEKENLEKQKMQQNESSKSPKRKISDMEMVHGGKQKNLKIKSINSK